MVNRYQTILVIEKRRVLIPGGEPRARSGSYLSAIARGPSLAKGCVCVCVSGRRVTSRSRALIDQSHDQIKTSIWDRIIAHQPGLSHVQWLGLKPLSQHLHTITRPCVSVCTRTCAHTLRIVILICSDCLPPHCVKAHSHEAARTSGAHVVGGNDVVVAATRHLNLEDVHAQPLLSLKCIVSFVFFHNLILAS